MNEPLRLLTGNAALQVFVSSLLGFAMLIPRQPWAKRLAPHFDQKALLSVHLDWLMLAFMQWGAVLVMTQWPGAARPWVAWLLVLGGWLNVLPYWCRAFPNRRVRARGQAGAGGRGRGEWSERHGAGGGVGAARLGAPRLAPHRGERARLHPVPIAALNGLEDEPPV